MPIVAFASLYSCIVVRSPSYTEGDVKNGNKNETKKFGNV